MNLKTLSLVGLMVSGVQKFQLFGNVSGKDPITIIGQYSRYLVVFGVRSACSVVMTLRASGLGNWGLATSISVVSSASVWSLAPSA